MKWTARNIVQGDDVELWRVESHGRTVEVRVPPGPDLLTRLERAARETLGLPTPAPPEPARYRIEVSQDSHGDLFELEQDTVWTVFDQAAGPLWEFRGGTSHVFEAGQWSSATGSHGCDEVVLSSDGLHVLVRDSDEVTCHPLPDA